jgi:hypothetical protein
MNEAQIQATIRKDKTAIKQAANRAYRLLRKYPNLQKEFAVIMEKGRKAQQLGAIPWFQMPVESLSGYGEEFILGQTPWYESVLESDFMTDLVGFGQKIVTHERIAKDEQRQLELELAQIQAKNEALDKQSALVTAMERSGTFTRSVGTQLSENPMTIPLLLGLGGLLIYMRMK